MATETKKTFKELSENERQDLGRKLVEREIHFCASSIVSKMSEYEPDDWFHLFIQDDWEQAAIDHIYHGMGDDEITDYLIDADIHDYLPEEAKNILHNHLRDTDWFEDFCQELNLDPHQTEIFEHWIISDWLADKLEAKDQVTDKGFHGLTIWGRPTTGQAIALDHVIQEIACENYL